MQDQEPNAHDGSAIRPREARRGEDWLDGVNAQLGDGADAVKAALEDVAAMCGGRTTPVAWVDTRKHPRLTVYVLDDGVVHVVDGERDRNPDQANLGDTAETKCVWRATPVTADARCSLLVMRTVGTTGGVTVARAWGLRFGDGDEDLAIGYPPSGGGFGRVADPAPFARALAAAITRAQARGDA